MEAPVTLDSYFSIVDDFFRKTFRDESLVVLALKTTQVSSLSDKDKLFTGQPDNAEVVNRKVHPFRLSSVETATAVAPSPSASTNVLTFSPRMFLNHDGKALGKVKLSCLFDIPRVCRAAQSLMLNSDGVVMGKTELRELLEGLVVRGRVSVNTIAPASADVTALTVSYRRNDLYYSTGYQRNGLGSSNLLVSCGTTFFNILAGAGFEHQRLSYLEQREGDPGQLGVLYAGLGFTGVDWGVAAKMTRTTDAWSGVRLALMQRLAASTLVACAYDFDLVASRAHVTLGFSQGLPICVPNFARSAAVGARAGSTNGAYAPVWVTLTNWVLACKAESTGLCAATLRGWFNDAIRWGVVVQKNVLQKDSTLRFGLTLSMEKG
ncbi:unnamed protein product [Phytomonas sp. Hart1]|nr:unnamed protein product [Phytomonas sp. Hart1]|eukprot:CCW66483.1 unnamed protein product [Phytomonas sp. isolate Hart1]